MIHFRNIIEHSAYSGVVPRCRHLATSVPRPPLLANPNLFRNPNTVFESTHLCTATTKSFSMAPALQIPRSTEMESLIDFFAQGNWWLPCTWLCGSDTTAAERCVLIRRAVWRVLSAGRQPMTSSNLTILQLPLQLPSLKNSFHCSTTKYRTITSANVHTY